MPEDIPWLWREVFNRVVRESGVEYELAEQVHGSIVSFLQNHSLPGNIRDLYALSWRVLAYWPDGGSIKQAEFSLWLGKAIEINEEVGSEDIARIVAERFVERGALDGLMSEDKPLDTKKIQREYLAWIGEEVRRIASQRGMSAEVLVDVTAKTLREWLKYKS
jgi:DNA-binding NtrC family response regulator